jgi:hypothetical protein
MTTSRSEHNEGEFLQAILARIDRGDCKDDRWPDAKGEYWPLCPYHADAHTGSLAVGPKGFKCFSCGASGGLRKLAQRLGVAVLQWFPEGQATYILTLAAYASAKRLDPDFLRGLGMAAPATLQKLAARCHLLTRFCAIMSA